MKKFHLKWQKLLPVALLASESVLAVAAHGEALCGKYCDGRAMVLATSQRAGAAENVAGRTVTLSFDDADDMGWATISGARPGDKFNLSRSFDQGTTWETLGQTTVLRAGRASYTALYDVDDFSGSKKGILKACAMVSGSKTWSCTASARSGWVWTRATWAATVLAKYFDNTTGMFDGNEWYNGAIALTALANNMTYSKMYNFKDILEKSYSKNLYSWEGNFANDYADDTGWWALAWISGYDATGDGRYLEMAQKGADHMATFANDTCGGGISWSVGNPVKNAVANELYIQVTAALHNRIPGDTKYGEAAKTTWAWFLQSGMINSSNLINDGLDKTCKNSNMFPLPYIQGVILGAAAELYTAYKDQSVLDEGRVLANASTTTSVLNQNGILGKNTPVNCDSDGSEAGVFIRGVDKLNRVLPDHPYSSYIDTNARSAFANARTSDGEYGFSWAGSYKNTNSACQQSAVDLMNAADYPPQ